jgi:putative protease
VPDVNKSFNRGFTDYFLDERKQCYNFTTPKSQGEYIGSVVKISKNYFEINSLKQLHPQDGLFFENDGCLINRIENTRIYPNKMPKIHVGTNVFRNYDAEFNKLLENSKIKRQIGVSIKVLGNCITVVDEDKNSITLPIPSKEKANDVKKMKENFIKQLEKTGESDFYIQNIEIADSVPFLPISAINELRRNLFENLMKERIKNYKQDIQKPLKYANFPQKEVDYKANIHNEKSKWFYEKCNCKVCEMSAESGSTPKELMRTKHCLKYAFDMCKSPKKLYLIDEKGVKYPLNFDCKNCEMSILNPNN